MQNLETQERMCVRHNVFMNKPVASRLSTDINDDDYGIRRTIYDFIWDKLLNVIHLRYTSVSFQSL